MGGQTRGWVWKISSVDPPVPARPIAPAAQQDAVAEANRLLASAVLPPGSRPVAHLPGRHLAGPAQLPACNPIEDATRLWAIPEAPTPLSAFLVSHVPTNMTNQVHGGSTFRGVPISYVVVDARTASSSDELVFTFARVGSWTGLRVDAVTVLRGATCLGGGSGRGSGDRPQAFVLETPPVPRTE